MRNVPRGVTVVDRDLYGRYVVGGHGDAADGQPRAIGDLQGAGYWPTELSNAFPPPGLQKRTIGSFWFAVAAVVTDGETPILLPTVDPSTGSVGQTRVRRSQFASTSPSGRGVKVRPLYDGQTEDTRYGALDVEVLDSDGAGSVEVGTHGVVLFGSREDAQRPIFVPSASRGATLRCPTKINPLEGAGLLEHLSGTPVYDLLPDGSIDPERFALLETAWQVKTGRPGQPGIGPGVLAWRLGFVTNGVDTADAREVMGISPAPNERLFLANKIHFRGSSEAQPSKPGDPLAAATQPFLAPLAFRAEPVQSRGNYAQFWDRVELRPSPTAAEWQWETPAWSLPFGDSPPPKKPPPPPPPPDPKKPPPGGDPPPHRRDGRPKKRLKRGSGSRTETESGQPQKPGGGSGLFYRLGPDHLLATKIAGVPLGQGGQPVLEEDGVKAAQLSGLLTESGRVATAAAYPWVGQAKRNKAILLGHHDRRPVQAATHVALGGIDIGAEETRRDRPALALGAAAQTEEIERKAMKAPAVSSIRGMAATYDGTWTGTEHDPNVSRGVQGGVVHLPPDMTLRDMLEGLVSPGGLVSRTIYPTGTHELLWGTLDEASGGAVSAVRITHDAAGVLFELLDGDGEVDPAAPTMRFGEGGLHVDGKIRGTGKATFDGEIDPTFLTMTEQAAKHGAVATEGIYWAKNDAPTTPHFEDDAGADHRLAYLTDIPAAGSALAVIAMPSRNAAPYFSWGPLGSAWITAGGTETLVQELDSARATSALKIQQTNTSGVGWLSFSLFVRVPDGFTTWGGNGARIKTRVASNPSGASLDLNLTTYDGDSVSATDTGTRNTSSTDASYVWVGVSQATLNATNTAAGDLLRLAVTVDNDTTDGATTDVRFGQIELDFE